MMGFRTACICLALGFVLASVVPPLRAAPDRTDGMALMSAVVNADSSLARGAGATGAEKILTGNYAVRFARDVRDCAYVVSTGSSEVYTWADSTASAASYAFDPAGVFVSIRDANDVNFVDRPFHLIVFCAS